MNYAYTSSYFVNDMKNFGVIYEKSYLLIVTRPFKCINQLNIIIEYKKNNGSLIIIVEKINKSVVSTLILNNIQKKLKITVVKFSYIKFLKTVILQDFSLLIHSHYFGLKIKGEIKNFKIEDLGQAEKVIIKKEKSTFIVSKFQKVIA
ncbi:MAG: hypothetical protein NXI18_16310 [Alphaproteobacteria bacterium]|nr:hypothetical protein [Alphaproteobacteria bacterium]